MAIFDDGTPLDASVLQDLDRRLNEIKSSIPKVGTSVVNNNTTVVNQTVSQKQIFGGVSNTFKLQPGTHVPFSISWSAESTPKSVVLTPAKSSGDLKGAISYAVTTGSLSASGCSGQIYLEKGATAFSIKFYYMVVCE